MNALIRLVVSGMFLLAKSASLMRVWSHFQETLSRVTTSLTGTPSEVGTLFWSPHGFVLDSFCCSNTLIVLFQQETNCSKLIVKLEKRCEICSKLTIKTPKRSHWHNYAVFIVNFKHIWQLFLHFYCSLLTGHYV